MSIKPCTNCRALERRIEHLEATEDEQTERIAELEAMLERAAAELSRARAFSRRLARHVVVLGGVLSGRIEVETLGVRACN